VASDLTKVSRDPPGHNAKICVQTLKVEKGWQSKRGAKPNVRNLKGICLKVGKVSKQGKDSRNLGPKLKQDKKGHEDS